MVTKNIPLERPGNLLISQRDQVFEAFRRWGHLQAKLDPLGQYLLPEPIPELNFEGEDAEVFRGARSGYFVGYRVAEKLASTRSLVDLVHWS